MLPKLHYNSMKKRLNLHKASSNIGSIMHRLSAAVPFAVSVLSAWAAEMSDLEV
jgi:hypothetical protein